MSQSRPSHPRIGQSRRTLLGLVAGLPFVSAFAVRAQTSAAPRVEMVTAKGTIVVEVYPDKAPITANYFLRMVGEKRYVKPAFYRTVHTETDEIHGFIQGGETVGSLLGLPPIAHESTDQTGLKHLDGTISMPRGKLGSANGHFFICIGDSPYMDAKPPQEGVDTFGFAAFGKVVEGMDVVKLIHEMPTSPTMGQGTMKGQMLDPKLPISPFRRLKA